MKYVKPELVQLGNVKELTQGGGDTNSDDGINADNAFKNPGES